MDTRLGKVNLTKGQISNLDSLIGGKIKGFGLVDDELVVVSDSSLNDSEKSSLIASVGALSNTDSKKADRKSRKQSIRTKLGLSKADISALKELLEDGDDN